MLLPSEIDDLLTILQSRRSQEWRKETAKYYEELKIDLKHGLLKPKHSDDVIQDLHKFVESEG